MIETYSRMGIALGLGLLVGLQRQRTDARLAGVRTFPLVTLLGALCGLMADSYGGWIVAAGMGGLAVAIVGGNFAIARSGEENAGVTTEVAMLLMYAIGAYLMVGSTSVALVTCGAVVLLLHLKPQLHTFASKIGDRDFTAVVQFALISLVVLPVLPNRYFGPYQVLNPFKIWLMVVLIVGVSLGGYVAYKLIGSRAGAWASGVLGGLISSTATTVSVSRRSKGAQGSLGIAAFVIMIASAIVFLRVGILLGVTAPSLLREAVVPLGALFAVLALAGWLSFRRGGSKEQPMPEHGNPTELKSALVFGALYAVVLLGVAAAKEYFGNQGLYAAAAISGLTDMDAITLSIANMVKLGEVGPGTGWRLILVAAISNLFFKAGMVAVLGGRRLLGNVAVGFGAAALVGAGLMVFL